MIDYEASAKLNNTTVEELKAWFKKYPKSNKMVWRVCEGEGCDDERKVIFYRCTNLCYKCSMKVPEKGKAHSEWMKNNLKKHPEIGKAHSEWMKNNLKEHPELVNDFKNRMTEYWSDQANCDAQAETLKNSDAHKAGSERMRGGNDITSHHNIYDHNDLSKYITEMTRSEHGLLHRNMQLLGLKVPHINTGYENAEELKLMEYISKIEPSQNLYKLSS